MATKHRRASHSSEGTPAATGGITAHADFCSSAGLPMSWTVSLHASNLQRLALIRIRQTFNGELSGRHPHGHPGLPHSTRACLSRRQLRLALPCSGASS